MSCAAMTVAIVDRYDGRTMKMVEDGAIIC
jgi:hypothetical protein